MAIISESPIQRTFLFEKQSWISCDETIRKCGGRIHVLPIHVTPDGRLRSNIVTGVCRMDAILCASLEVDARCLRMMRIWSDINEPRSSTTATSRLLADERPIGQFKDNATTITQSKECIV
jgi:hypothetical protein